MQRLLLLGLNHTTAPLPVREKLAFNAGAQSEALAALKIRFPESEVVLLSTCNRVEIYTARPVHGHPRSEELVDFLSSTRQLDPAEFRPRLYEKTDRDVATHLFSVASSLDSMVLGETQILGQVREAYDAAVSSQTACPMINPLFQRALAVGKRVMSHTPITEGRLSVASVAVDYARRIFDHFVDKTVLSIGAGKMATLVLQGFSTLHPGHLLVCNRDGEKAKLLADKFTGQAVPFTNLADHLASADIVLTSTGSTQPIISRSMLQAALKKRKYRPIFIIDIALPRDVEESAGKLEHVYLYNIDDLQLAVAGARAHRQDALEAARTIVNHEVEEYIAWHRQRELGPIIEQLFARYHRIAKGELDRMLHKMPDLPPEHRAHLEDLARRIVNKVLHDPIQMLKSSDQSHGPAAQYLHAMEKLFGLDRDDETKSDDEQGA